MSILKQAVSGPIQKKDYIALMGVAGVGKTTFASRFPNPIFFDLEGGSNQLDVTRLKPASFNLCIQAVDELTTTEHTYETLVIDSVDHLELLIWDEVIKEDGKARNIADIPYGGGYAQALSKWKILGERLKVLREKMNVILIAHSIVKTINDPSLPTAYDKHVIKLHQKAADYIKESVDAVLFANYEVFVAKKNDRDAKGKAIGEGKRILSTMATPSAEGKNRYGLPPIIEFDYDAYIRAKSECDPTDPVKIAERIKHYLPQLKDENMREKAAVVFAKAENSIPALLKLEQKLKTIIETN